MNRNTQLNHARKSAPDSLSRTDRQCENETWDLREYQTPVTVHELKLLCKYWAEQIVCEYVGSGDLGHPLRRKHPGWQRLVSLGMVLGLGELTEVLHNISNDLDFQDLIDEEVMDLAAANR